ncbi:MAG: TolC family protein [Calditrichaceae bacterium]|nr:TolC family protein [Calditrichaceae bacterium]MBN2708316.1 TolC family protein [Calditrichaceae bacterium]RQV97229.1 MAG: TolC family protein [Calditrichota bacterium]
MFQFRKLLILIWLFICILNLLAEEITFSDIPVLDQYIKKGLLDNLALQQKEFSYESSIKTLDEARGLFFPSVNIEARYSKSDGGRIIEFPVGDLMNPVYQGINDLLISLGQPTRPYPTLQNEQIPFLRETEHDTKLRIIQPVFNTSIWFNYNIKSDMKDISLLETSAYKRELIFEIKKAYYNVLKIDHLVKLAWQTKVLIEENLRISHKLFDNQKVTKDVVYRVKSDLSGIEQYIAEIENAQKMAAYYFNFLLNRPLDEYIEIVQDNNLNFPDEFEIEEQKQIALKNREEIKKIEKAIEITESGQKLAVSEFLPSVNLIGDIGYQGEDYYFDSEHDYKMLSAVATWNLFRGFQDKAKYQQAEINRKRIEKQLEEVKNQIQLQVEDIILKIKAARLSITAANEQEISARESFRLTEKKYEEGMAAQIEYLDARKNWTEAQVNQISAGFTFLVKKAELEKIAASLPLEPEQEN